MNQYDEQLTRELNARAGDLPPHPFALDDVKRRATRIRWQRRAMAGTVAAVVLAIAIPVGLSVTGGTDRTDPPIAPEPTPSPIPTEASYVVLTTDVPEGGGEPAVPYFYDGAIHLTDGEVIEVQGSYDGFAPYGDGWALTGSNQNGYRFVTFVDEQGAEVAEIPSTGAIELSRDGTLLSYFDRSDSTLRVVGDEGLPGWELPTNGEAELYPGAVLGSESCQDGGCVVYYNDDMRGIAGVSSGDGSVHDDEIFQEVAGNNADGGVTGQISYTDDGSCSALRRASGETAWETCDYTLGEFSPDERLVLGHPAYRDGVGDGLVAILNAATGDLVAEFKNNQETQAFINNVIWETDTTVLATVFQRGTWSLMRMTMDGELIKVTDLEGSDDVSPPLFLPVMP